MKKRGFCFILVLGLSGCASSRKDFNEKSIKPGQAAVIGQVNIRYNGKLKNKQCYVCFNSVNGPCQKLDDDGLVFLSVPQGQGSLRRVECQDVSRQHYNLQDVVFNVREGVNYFGAVDLSWQNQGGFKATDMFGAIGAALSESKNDGTLQIRVREGEINKIVQEYERQTSQSKLTVNKSLLSETR